MSFNRLRDDPATYQIDNQESQSPGKYMLYSGYGASDGVCFADAPTGNSHDKVPYASVVDQESELRNLARPLTKDPSQEYPFKQYDVDFQTTLPDCSPMSTQENSRFTPYIERKDIQVLRNINRSDALCENPQAEFRIPANTRSGMDSRLVYRDNYNPNLSSIPLHDADNSFVSHGSRAILNPVKSNCSACAEWETS
jgi:hypothetical protein